MAMRLIQRCLSLLGIAPDCEWVQDRLGEYWHCELSRTEALTVRRHLSRCAECEAEWASVQQMSKLLVQTAFIERHGRDALIGLRRMIDQTVADGRERATSRRRIRIPHWAAASAILLILAVPVAAMVQHWTGQARLEQEELPVQPADTRLASVPPIATFIFEPVRVATPLAKHEIEKSDPSIQLFINQEIDQFAARIMVEAMMPHTEEEYEKWARHEFPHIMWLYDILKKDYRWEGTWRELVVGSGVAFQFDSPRDNQTMNCALRLFDLLNGVARVGFSAELNSSHGYELPALQWMDSPIPQIEQYFVLHRVCDEVKITRVSEIPSEYSTFLSKERELTISVLRYLVISNSLIDKPEFITLAQRSRGLLIKILLSPEMCNQDIETELCDIFRFRRSILESNLIQIVSMK